MIDEDQWGESREKKKDRRVSVVLFVFSTHIEMK